jgi:hypothetical protein
MVDIENWCRTEYFRLIDEKHGHKPVSEASAENAKSQ